VTANAITAASLNQTDGTGTTTLNGAVNTNTAAGVTIVNETIAVNAGITTTNNGVVTLNADTTTLTIAAAGDIVADGAVSLTGVTGISTAGDITTTADAIDVNSNTVLTGSIALNSAGGNISFDGTLNGTVAGAQNVTITAGTGDVTFTGAVGGGTRLGAISIVSADDVTANAITAASLNQTDGTGTTTLNGAVNTNTAAGVTIVNETIAVNAGITTTNNGVVTLNADTTTLTIAAAGDIVADGAVSLTGATGISTAGDITTTADAIDFNSNTTLTGSIVLNSAGGNISFDGTLNGTAAGAQNLTITAGTGDVTFTGAVGGTMRLGAISIVSADDVTANAITAASLSQTDGTGTTTLNGAVNTSAAGGVSLTNETIVVNNTITTTNNGVVTLNADTVTLTIAATGDIVADGAVSLTGATGISTAGDITTTADAIDFNSNTTLTSSIALNSADGNISFDGTLNGTAAGAQNLTITAGAGDVTFTGAVGGGVRLGAISIVSADDVTANAVTAASLSQTDGTGTTTLNGAVNTSAAGGVSLTNETIVVNNTITTTNGGPVTLNADTATLTVAAAGDINSDGAVSLTGATGIGTAGDITTTADAIDFNSNTTLTGSIVLNSAGGNISFDGTLNGTAAGAQNLTITAGAGDVTFTGAVGGGVRLGAISIVSADDVTANAITAVSLNTTTAGNQTYNQAITVDTATTIRSGGTTTINRAFTRASGDLTLAVHDLDITATGSIVSTAPANVTITTDTAAQAITIGGTGGLSLDGAELNRIQNVPHLTIGDAAHTGTITVTGATTLTSSGLLDFSITNAGSAGGGTPGIDSIVFNGTLASPKPVFVTTGNGNIRFGAGGKILASGAGADATVNLDATNGFINGDAANVTGFIAGSTFSNVQAVRLNAHAAKGIGVANALITDVDEVQAATTGIDTAINIYNLGDLQIAGTGIVAGTAALTDAQHGNVTLVATGNISQAATAPVIADALAVVTLKGANASAAGGDITLTNASNNAESYSLFACLELAAGGCVAGTPVLSTNGTGFGSIAGGATYGAGAIQYRDSNGANLSGIGTVSAFSTFTNGDSIVNANSISASTITLEAKGSITLDLTGPLLRINNTGTGSFNLLARDDIKMVGTSASIGASASSPFNHDLTFTAGGDITVNGSIFAGRNLALTADAAFNSGNQPPVTSNNAGNVTLTGNHMVSVGGDVTVRGVNFSLLGCESGVGSCTSVDQSVNGQELLASGAINLLNSGVIAVRAGTSSGVSGAGARLQGGTVNIGASGAGANPTQLIIEGGVNSVGVATSDTSSPTIERQQANAVVRSDGDMNVYLRGAALTAAADGVPFNDIYSVIIRGGTANASNPGSAPLFVTALGALQARKLTMETDGTILFQGGTANLGSTNALAAASAVLLVQNEKTITTRNGGSVVLIGGNANVAATDPHRGIPLTSISARNALALAQLDPSKLTMTVDGILVLQGGRTTGPLGALASARIDASDQINITVNGTKSYSYPGSGTLGPASMYMIGGSDSGFFDRNNVDLAGSLAYPQANPITITLAGGFLKVLDAGLAGAVVQTGLTTFDNSLLSYVIFAANVETRALRFRRGLGGDDDVGAPACK
jgi:hypothetical protein